MSPRKETDPKHLLYHADNVDGLGFSEMAGDIQSVTAEGLVENHGNRPRDLSETEQRYRDLVNNAHDIIYLTDFKGLFTLANPVALRVTGYSEQEIIGRHFGQLIHPDYREKVEEFYQTQFTENVSNTYYEFPILTKQGNLVWLGQNVQLIREAGRIVGFQSICRNITKRKKTEEQLQASENRFRLLAEAAPFGLSVMGGDRKFYYLNPKFTEIFGYTVEDIPDKDTWFLKAYPDASDRSKVTATWQSDTVENVLPGEVIPRVFVVRCKDGKDKVIKFRAVVMEDGWQILTYEDITIQSLAEEALKEKEQMLANILAASPVGICRIDGRRFSWVNEAMVKMFGYDSPQDLMGESTRKMYASEDEYDRVGAMLYAQYKMGAESETYAKFVRKDGSLFDGHIRISVPDPENRMKSTIAAFSDVSRIKEAELALQKSERRYRALVEQVPDVIFSLDTAGCFTFVNSQAEKFLGRSIADMLGTPLWNYCDSEYTTIAQSILRLSAETIWDEEMGIHDAQGVKKWVRIRCAVIEDDEGTPTGYEGVLIDATVKKILEEELKASKDDLLAKIKIIDDLYAHIMQSGKSQAIAEHTAEVAHELRQPLAIIGGFVRRMATQAKAGESCGDKANKEWFEIIIREVQRLENILRGLIDFCKQEDIRLEQTDPNKLIVDVLKIHEERFMEKGLVLEVNLGRGVGEIFVDRRLFEQVIRNLISNAIEASEQYGVITIDTGVFVPTDKEQETGGLRAEKYFQMKIGNRGRIIPQEELQKFFDPFYTTKEYGIGMGLTLVKRIVAEHKGSISVKSNQAGTVFTLWFPHGHNEAT